MKFTNEVSRKAGLPITGRIQDVTNDPEVVKAFWDNVKWLGYSLGRMGNIAYPNDPTACRGIVQKYGTDQQWTLEQVQKAFKVN